MYFTDNRYTDDCHYKGGTLQMLYDMGTYGLSMVVQNALPPDLASSERWAEVWEEHLRNEPWIIRWLEHQTYDEQWRHGSLCEDYAAIQCATFLIGGWRDGYTNCNLRVFQHLRCPKKALIGPWLHVVPDAGIPGPRVDHLHEMVRFYDYWLRGVDDGVMAEPLARSYSELPIWRVTHDHIAGTTEVHIRTGGRARLDDGTEIVRSSDASATASQRDPARATMRGLNQVTLRWLDRTIDTRARGQIESTADALHVTIQLDIRMNGVPYHSRRWARSIPRNLI
jgi:predicted acyl esterase